MCLYVHMDASTLQEATLWLPAGMEMGPDDNCQAKLQGHLVTK